MNEMNHTNETSAAADTVEGLMNSLRGGEQTPISAANATTVMPPVSSAASGEEDLKVIPKSKLAAPQWYQTNPALYQAEIAAWRKEMKNPTLQPKFMPDGRMYWTVKCRPNIGPEFNTLEYTLLLIYDADHPSCRYGSSVKVYNLKPSLNELESLVKKIPGLSPKYIPHTISDGSGQRYLCTSRVSDTSDNFSTGATSAVTSYRYAYNWLTVFEGAIRDPQGLWKDFHNHGVV